LKEGYKTSKFQLSQVSESSLINLDQQIKGIDEESPMNHFEGIGRNQMYKYNDLLSSVR